MPDKTLNKFYSYCGKRIFDLVITLPLLILFSPILVVTALLVRLKLGRPVLFRQIRPGLNGKPFAILKFRTMTEGRDKSGNLLPVVERLTSFGAFLRKTSIDELPELINVLKGDMSIVGPRPLLLNYLPYYTSRERLRHNLRPGITGFSQINGRNYLPWDERLEMDVRYVETISVWLDVKIIIRTFFQVMKGKDVVVLPGKVSVYLSEYRQQQKKKS